MSLCQHTQRLVSQVRRQALAWCQASRVGGAAASAARKSARLAAARAAFKASLVCSRHS